VSAHKQKKIQKQANSHESSLNGEGAFTIKTVKQGKSKKKPVLRHLYPTKQTAGQTPNKAWPADD